MRGILAGAAILLPTLVAATESRQPPRPDELVHLQVTGTSIRSAPWRIFIVIEPDEREAVTGLLDRQDRALDCLLSSDGGRFSYCKPQECRLLPEFMPIPGDVIYVYRTRSPESRDAFAAEHALAPTDRAGQVVEGDAELYSSSPGYYVMLVIPAEPYSCAMHPHQRSAEPGHCPICGMEMIEAAGH